ncbi:uncharacterized protein LOC107413251 [Ziziphus jujuba]|uniref:Uncharacterized protein LOC107413251 n=1 Tax=Ziziphus jujuba TaxID=326968 RepID=A0A6P3ZEE9_ZIZJJ|nr:uncharacterized protein LOC107413251 [Ziziphus jujuba]XP_048326162.2 uncharacterized protein LOC107413251 [Ziziphus jujuba]
MHTIKGGWVGRPFALAKSNESERRKTRIRRSKEERKTMVESFIKKYQNLNNGSFPSLNLTHKEVGGSFYTVREIVRDVIQENRVLGPAKFSPEEQSRNQLLEQDPLGSIATGPQYPLTALSNDHQFITNHCEGIGEPVIEYDAHYERSEHQMFANGEIINDTELDVKLEEFNESKHTTLQGSEPVEAEENADGESDEEAVSVSDGQYTGSVHQIIDNELIINGNQVDVEKRESNELTEKDLVLSETDSQMNVSSKEEIVQEELGTSSVKVTPTATDVIVETFPLRPITKRNDISDRGISEIKDTTDTLKNQETKKVDLAADAHKSLNDRIKYLEHSGVVDEKEVATNSSPVLEKNSSIKDEEAEKNHGDLLLESSNFPAPKEGAGQEIQSYKDSAAKEFQNHVKSSETFEQSQANAGAKDIRTPNGIYKRYVDSNGSSSGQSKTENVPVTENQVEVDVHGDSIKNGSNPTLDRINLESWDGKAKTSAKPEGNPFLAFLRVCVASFVKFWSE